MTDEWAIASLNQVIEEEDDDDVLIPPTPGQEDIDLTASQESSSLLSALSDSQAAGRRKMHTLSLGLPDDPESESLPFLALEWDPQFPPTPAPENGQSADNLLSTKEENRVGKNHLTSESYNGQRTVWEGCSTSWLTKDAETSGMRTSTGGSGDEDTNKDRRKDCSEESKREEKNVDDRGGGFTKSGRGSKNDDRGNGSGDEGDGEDDRPYKRKRKYSKEEEESSHEPSSDSSEGLVSFPEDLKKKEKDKKDNDGNITYVAPRIGHGELTIGTPARNDTEFGEEVDSSQKDLFASQPDESKDTKKPNTLDNKPMNLAASVSTASYHVPSLHLSQSTETVPSSPGKLFQDTPASAVPTSSASSQFSSVCSASPSKRKYISDDDRDHEIPCKQLRTNESSGSNESGEDKVFVDYPSLTKKDVEISPKQYRHPFKNTKPIQETGIARQITFPPSNAGSSSGEKEVILRKTYSESMDEEIELPSLIPSDTSGEGFSLGGPPRRLPVDTEEENSDVSGGVAKGSRSTHSADDDAKDISSDEDSDIEVIENKDKSIEVVYEKAKTQTCSYSDDVGSQDFSLMLSGTQRQQSFDSEEHGQRFSEDHGFSEVMASERHSQNILPLSDLDDVKGQGSLSSSCDEVRGNRDHDMTNTIRATQLEEICKPADLTQPDIEPLISLPLSKSSKSSGEVYETKLMAQKMEDDGVEVADAYKDDTERKVERDINLEGTTHGLTIPIQSEDQRQISTSMPKFQMPDIATPTSQDLIVADLSESLFVKANNAAKERVLQEKVLESKIDNSLEIMDTSISKADNHNLSEDIRAEFTSTESTPVSGLQPSRSSQSTPISSQVQNFQSQNVNLFGSASKGDISGSSLQSSKILAEETDSEEEGHHVLKKKLKTEMKSKSVAVDSKALPGNLKHTLKTSTPDNSGGVHHSLSGVSESDIDKDPTGMSISVDTSKSHSSTPEDSIIRDKPKFGKRAGGIKSTQDTEVLDSSDDFPSMDELNASSQESIGQWQLVRYRYRDKSFVVVYDSSLDSVHTPTDQNVISIHEIEHGAVNRILLKNTGGSESIVHSSYRSGRMSDVSLWSRTTSSSGSGYLGDKSSSSSSSHRMSIASVTTISPPRGHQKSQDDGHCFVIPAARNRAGRGAATSPKIITLDEGKSPEKSSSHELILKNTRDSSTSTSDDAPFQVKRKGRGRARGRSSNNKISDQTPGQERRQGRARGRGRGRGRGVKLLSVEQSKDSLTERIDEIAPEEVVLPVHKDEIKGDVSSERLGEPADSVNMIPNYILNIMNNSQLPLSEEEEEVFVSQGGANEERQLAQVMKRVREVDLKSNMLVFARFIDSTYYSAVLTKKDGFERWFVRFTLDQHDASVRDVYILPTDILPRGHPCRVRNSLDFIDGGIVKGHVRVGSTIYHIIQTDRGSALRVPHSHIILTEKMASDLLQTRLKFRSLVTSPGRDVSLDNIVAGRRRRMPNKEISSPHSRKIDENFDSSENTCDSDGRNASSQGQRSGRKQLLSALPEESESDMDTSYKPSTPRGRKRQGSSRGSRTPKTPRTPKISEASTSVAVNPGEDKPFHASEVQAEEMPNTPLKKRGRSYSNKSPSMTPEKLKLDIVNPDLQLGPPSLENSCLFSGFEVLLTIGDSKLKRCESSDEEILPFDKEHYKNLIVQGGGRIIDSYAEAEMNLAQHGRPNLSSKTKKTLVQPATTILLISNTHCRTSKFIQCLAAGIPIVSHLWIKDCSEQGKYLEWKHYLLPSGENEMGDFVEQVLGDGSSPPVILSKEKIFLGSSSNSEFNSLWQTILTTAGADVRVKPTTKKGNGNVNRVLVKSINVVVADTTIPENELQRADQLSIPVVTTEWIIQSLIAGRKLDYRDNQKFKLNAGVASASSKPGDN